MENAVVKSILAEAEQKAKEIVKEGSKQADKIKKDSEKQSLQNQKDFLEQEKKSNKELLKKEVSKTGIELKKKMLDKKREFIDKAFVDALEGLKKLPEAKKKTILKKLLTQALKEMDDAKYFYSNEADKKIIKSINSNLSFADLVNTAGGVILENKDKTVRINNTFEVLMYKIRERETNEVNSILFK